MELKEEFVSESIMSAGEHKFGPCDSLRAQDCSGGSASSYAVSSIDFSCKNKVLPMFELILKYEFFLVR